MSFEVPAAAYERFIGAYSSRLALGFIEFAGVHAGQRVVEVGCGPGALTVQLVDRVGPDLVVAVDPSTSFVEAARLRFPGVDVRAGVAEELPDADDTFDAALAQLVVHFMQDPVAGLREMGRVTKPGGFVAACVWDHNGGLGPFAAFWSAARDLDPGVDDESGRAGTREGQLVELCVAAGLDAIESSMLTVHRPYESFDDWWEPFTFGIGPAGAYVADLDDAHREALRERCVAYVPAAPFEIAASAWAVRARV
ncbi:MAG TPA: class I SAM-dependent methyltransferase [Nocardioidaceae bacterium]|nr:class I SAM-dependent methyltransferase [Nocardioidaceae bacterium]